MDWRNAPDESAAESARLDRSGNRYASWPDQTDAETARLARSGNAYAAWPDQTDAETARLGRYESRARFMEGMERSWAKQDAAASALALQRQHANADAYRVQLAREAFNFGDGMDARDIRLNSFSYQSRLSVELSKANAEQQMRARFDAGPKLVAGAGVERLSGAESYLRRMNGGLDPVRAGNFKFQVAQSLPDAAAVIAGPEMLLGRLAPVLGRGLTATQRAVMGEESVLMSSLRAEMRASLRADLPAIAPIGGIGNTGNVGPTVGAKLSFDPSLNAVDRAFAVQAGEITAANPVARASYARLQRQGTDVVFVNNPEMAEMGLFDPNRNTVTINMLQHESPQEAVSTLVHEATYQNRFFGSGVSPGTQFEEYLSFRNEFLFTNGRRPTLLERQQIINDVVKPLYPQLPPGPLPLFGL